MQYLGGKTRLAGRIAEIVNAERVRLGGAAGPLPFWEPFCGGLSVSVKLAALGPGIVSDACLPLISLYRAVRDGWDPPETLSEDEYRAARSLPDTDPRKAFAGFGCSFGGMYFSKYVGPRTIHHTTTGQIQKLDAAGSTARALRRQIPALRGCALECMSFFDARPIPGLVLYCDPPYAGTSEYSAAGAFNSEAFWARARAWAGAGAVVFVSEYVCPISAVAVASWSHSLRLHGAERSGARTERLFRVLP